MLRAFGKMGII